MDYRDTVMDYWSTEDFLEQLSIHNRIIYLFIIPLNKYGVGAIPIEFAQVHWLRLFPMWVRINLHSAFIEYGVILQPPTHPWILP
jgi:hypothetical protein